MNFGGVSVTSWTATNLPTNGAPLYARLWSLTAGTWQVADYTYGFAHNTTVPAFNADGTTVAFPSAKVAKGYDFVGDDYNADPTSATFQPVPHPDPNPLDCPAATVRRRLHYARQEFEQLLCAGDPAGKRRSP